MSDLRRTNGRNWRRYLTPQERQEISELERIIARAERMAIFPRARRARIQNRATARAGKSGS